VSTSSKREKRLRVVIRSVPTSHAAAAAPEDAKHARDDDDDYECFEHPRHRAR